MKLLLITLTLLLNSYIYAREFRLLKDVHHEFSTIYSNEGNDNNYLESIHYKTSDILEIKPQIPTSRVQEISYTQAFSVIKKCVFMGNGAYGDHLTNHQQNILSKKLLQTFHQDFILSPTLYIVTNIQLEMINQECALLAVGKLNNEAIIIQGVSID